MIFNYGGGSKSKKPYLQVGYNLPVTNSPVAIKDYFVTGQNRHNIKTNTDTTLSNLVESSTGLNEQYASSNNIALLDGYIYILQASADSNSVSIKKIDIENDTSSTIFTFSKIANTAMWNFCITSDGNALYFSSFHLSTGHYTYLTLIKLTVSSGGVQETKLIDNTKCYIELNGSTSTEYLYHRIAYVRGKNAIFVTSTGTSAMYGKPLLYYLDTNATTYGKANGCENTGALYAVGDILYGYTGQSERLQYISVDYVMTKYESYRESWESLSGLTGDRCGPSDKDGAIAYVIGSSLKTILYPDK